MMQKDEGFKDVEPAVVDMMQLINVKMGVPNFWLKTMMNHPQISQQISEKDRLIFQYLKDVRLVLHEDYGFGFDLVFHFEKKNSYFLEEILTKKFVMSRQNVIEKAEGTKINWKEGCDPTIKKVKKKRKGKKVNVQVPQKSFFNFFDITRMPTESELKEGKL